MSQELQSSMEMLNNLGFEGVVAVYAESCEGRELFIASPFRTKTLRQRIEEKVSLDLVMMKDSYIEVNAAKLPDSEVRQATGDNPGQVSASTSKEENQVKLNRSLSENKDALPTYEGCRNDQLKSLGKLAKKCNEEYMISMMQDLSKLETLLSGVMSPAISNNKEVEPDVCRLILPQHEQDRQSR